MSGLLFTQPYLSSKCLRANNIQINQPWSKSQIRNNGVARLVQYERDDGRSATAAQAQTAFC